MAVLRKDKLRIEVTAQMNYDGDKPFEEFFVDASGEGWHTRYSGTQIKMIKVLMRYTKTLKPAMNLTHKASGERIRRAKAEAKN